MLKSKILMKQIPYNFFCEPYNLYGLYFKGTYGADISYPSC